MAWLSLWTSVVLAAPLPSIDTAVATGATAPHDAAVVIGLSDYVFLPDVPYADADADAVADHMIRTVGVPRERVAILTAAGREQVMAALERASTATGTVWVYFAGHGVAAPSDGHRLLLGDDTRADPVAFEARGVRLDEVEAVATRGGADLVLWVDACFSGQARDGTDFLGGTRLAVPDYVAPATPGVWHAAAAGPGQVAHPLDAAGHGAFTYLTLGALRGWADGSLDDRRDGVVTADEAAHYVTRGLRAVGLPEQQPVFLGAGDRALAEGVHDVPPSLQEGVLQGPRALPLPAPGTGPWFSDDALAAAAAWGHRLPLRKTLLGRRDADDQRVPPRAYWGMIRDTEQGRRGLRTQTVGTVVAGVGALGFMGTFLGGFLADDPTWFVGTGLSVAAVAGGAGVIAVGQGNAQRALEPTATR